MNSRYKILKPIMLSFLTRQDQYDSTFHPGDGWDLESDGTTIWIVRGKAGKKRSESITTANAIDLWLEEGKIKEL